MHFGIGGGHAQWCAVKRVDEWEFRASVFGGEGFLKATLGAHDGFGAQVDDLLFGEIDGLHSDAWVCDGDGVGAGVGSACESGFFVVGHGGSFKLDSSAVKRAVSASI